MFIILFICLVLIVVFLEFFFYLNVIKSYFVRENIECATLTDVFETTLYLYQRLPHLKAQTWCILLYQKQPVSKWMWGQRSDRKEIVWVIYRQMTDNKKFSRPHNELFIFFIIKKNIKDSNVSLCHNSLYINKVWPTLPTWFHHFC